MQNQKIIVSTTLTRNKDKKIIIGTQTKTGRKNKKSGKSNTRYVPFAVLTDEDAFISILKEQQKIAKANSKNLNKLLFCTNDGNFIAHASINAIFKRICRTARVKLELVDGCHIHMTKHTAVTELIESDMNIYVISEIVGTSVNVLQKTYAHVLDSFVKKEIEKVKINRQKSAISASNYEIQGNCKIIPFKRM